MAAGSQVQLHCPLELYPLAFSFSCTSLFRTPFRQAAELPTEETAISVSLDRWSIYLIFPHTRCFGLGFAAFIPCI